MEKPMSLLFAAIGGYGTIEDDAIKAATFRLIRALTTDLDTVEFEASEHVEERMRILSEAMNAVDEERQEEEETIAEREIESELDIEEADDIEDEEDEEDDEDEDEYDEDEDPLAGFDDDDDEDEEDPVMEVSPDIQLAK